MKTLNICGKDLPFRFSLNAIKIYCEQKGITVNEFLTDTSSQVGDVSNVEDLVYAGLKGAALREGKDLEVSKQDISNYIDDLGMKEITPFINQLTGLITDSIVTDETKKATPEEAEKSPA